LTYANGSNLTWDKNMDKDVAAFLEGKLAMYPAPSWRLMDIMQYNQKYNLGLEIGVAQMPQVANSYEVYWPTYWGLTVSKDCQHPDVAWKFIQFMTANSQLQLLNTTVKANGRPLGILYPKLDLANSENIKDTYLAPYAISLGKAADWDMYDGWELKKAFDVMFVDQVQIARLEGAINNVRKKK
jgi:ABC-type glycerol-3-phosphate transport system substrate-binding protein